VIILNDQTPSNLTIVASNIPALMGNGGQNVVPAIISRSGPIYITFNQAVDPTGTKVTVLDEAGVAVNTQPTAVFGYNTLTLNFSPALPDVPAEYNLVLHAVAAAGAGQLRSDVWAPFFTPVPTQMLKPTLTRESDGSTDWIHVTFHEPIGTGVSGYNMLQGSNCVIFFSIELGTGSTTIGDDAGETGNANCLAWESFSSDEVDPTGIAGLSGYATRWTFQLPIVPSLTTPVPSQTPVQLVFSHVADAHYIMKRVNGQPVPDFAGSTLALMLP
jgi:hypothetical protein